jgi:hypothetical protein
MVMSPAGLGTKNYCAGEDLQKFISQSGSQWIVKAVVRWQPGGNRVNTEADDIVGIHCQATSGNDMEDLVQATVNSRVREREVTYSHL